MLFGELEGNRLGILDERALDWLHLAFEKGEVLGECEKCPGVFLSGPPVAVVAGGEEFGGQFPDLGGLGFGVGPSHEVDGPFAGGTAKPGGNLW